ncbi:MAG: hypothetical protein ACXAC8_17950 [Candidatus Hodarchaeales archaeon]|jgi:cellulose biosynthesis protein BcsQ
MFLTETPIPDEIPLPPIITFFSSMAVQECMFLSLGLARAFTLQGYKTILMDWNFASPILSYLFEKKGFTIEEPNLSNFYVNPDLNVKATDLIDLCIKIPIQENNNLLFLPISTELPMTRIIENTDEKTIRKAYRKITQAIRNLQEDHQFDVLIINSQDSVNQHTINSLLVSTANYCITQDTQDNLSMVSKIDEYLTGINPLLRISGLIINNYHALPTPISNRQKIAHMEIELGVPIVGCLINVTNHIQFFPLSELLNQQEWELDDYLKDLSLIILESTLNPRVIGAEIPLLLHSLLVIDKAGVLFYSYSFPESKLTREVLASAGLTAVVTGLAQLISELVRRRQTTNLIDLSGVKVYIEEGKKLRVILLASKYDEEIPLRLKNFLRKFVEKYHIQIKNWVGKVLELEGADALVLAHFEELLEPKDENKD